MALSWDDHDNNNNNPKLLIFALFRYELHHVELRPVQLLDVCDSRPQAEETVRLRLGGGRLMEHRSSHVPHSCSASPLLGGGEKTKHAVFASLIRYFNTV